MTTIELLGRECGLRVFRCDSQSLNAPTGYSSIDAVKVTTSVGLVGSKTLAVEQEDRVDGGAVVE